MTRRQARAHPFGRTRRPPPARSHRRSRPVWAAAACLAVAALGACVDGEPPPPQGSEAAQAPAPGNFRGRVYERSFVFTAPDTDTAFTVPMLFTAATRPGGVDRTARGWLRRGTTWDAFHQERWEGPPNRAPWRILPHGSLRLVVGEQDAVETILFEEGPRALELEFGDVLTEWTGAGGEIFRLQRSALYLSDQRIPGLVLDASRTRASDDPPAGDWAFLTSGDSLQVVLASPEQGPPGAEGAYRGWARLDFRDLHWPEVTVAWTETSAFQPARQDVPVSWEVRGGDDLTGTLDVQTAQLEAGEGPGPLLPVDGLLGVIGQLVVEGRTFPVRGLIRHTRP